MTNIIFLTMGTTGDVQPLLHLGQALQQRGHAITLITHSPYETLSCELGFDFAALDQPEEYEKFIEEAFLVNTPAGTLLHYQRYYLPKFHKQYTLIAEHTRPGETIVVAHFSLHLAAQIAAEKLGLPLVTLFLAPQQIATIPILEQGLAATLGADLNAFRAQLALPPIRQWRVWLRHASTCLALWPDWFAPPELDWSPEVVHQTGFLLPRPESTEPASDLPSEVWTVLAEHKHPILITGGTGAFVGADFYTACIEACQQLGLPALLVTQNRNSIPPVLPSGVWWFKSLPFNHLLPQVSAIIHHGGIGTAAQALAAGVPQLVLAVGIDRPDNALRLVDFGVAEFLPRPQWSSEKIVAAIQRLTSSSTVRACCQMLAERLVNEADATIAACAVIESLKPAPDFTAIYQSEREATFSPPPDSEMQKEARLKMIEGLSPEKRQAVLALRAKKGKAPPPQSQDDGSSDPT